MKHILLSTLLLMVLMAALGSCVQPASTPPASEPEQLAQQQLDAYNAGDINAFLIPYADSVKVFRIPSSEPYMVGVEAMRAAYSAYFERVPDLHCELVSRMVVGNTVVDQEHITGFPDGTESDAIALYKMAFGKIVEVHFHRPGPYIDELEEKEE